ncbi:MAG: ABC-F family ATP-binding cassette domain-containing protein [Clostridiales bacterium]|nr:ABC-F family ATP-binding cassette domain-containing protein [Clostridiales bacterium]
MIIVTLNNIVKSYGINTVLDKISLTINTDEKVGIVGNNGAGKSTLFNIITGRITVDDGQIFSAKDINIGYLIQADSTSDDINLYDYCLEPFENLINIENKMRKIENLLTDNPFDNELIDEYSNLTETFTQLNGYAYHSKARGVLIGLGFAEDDFNRTIKTLSGG